ncbi:MAG: YifB family Mg chelatase-like AAA ATPase [Candidatus Gastranaerophilales bacterium]|nr:YifB family Mg chelatase-like AAA ATPase [Candidatus Gastranaerophilales bacterium]
MYSKILSGALSGVQAYLVGVEVDIASGLPSFNMVGSLGGEVRESRERVSVALRNAGFSMPCAHITVNLSPADRRKEGTAFDLPIAVGILQSMEYFQAEASSTTLFLGELGLNGELRQVRGVLPIVQEARRQGIKECIVPMENAREGAVVPGITVRGARNIGEVFAFLRAGRDDSVLEAAFVDVARLMEDERENDEDFSQVNGQENAKRAAEIAAAGFHSLLMTGPPGVGKSLIAKRIPGILPPLSMEECLEVTALYSVAGALEGAALKTERPFQRPHHTVTQAALIGGGMYPRPGLISLSHRGVLFLDELPQFSREILDSLRQPLEDNKVCVDRVQESVFYPAEFMLVCAMNPCPCGYYPDLNRCRCTEPQIRKYMGKVSGPIMDRIDLCVELRPVEFAGLHAGKRGESSQCIRERVLAARKRQKERFEGSGYRFNSDIQASDVERCCFLGKKEQSCAEQIYDSLQLSARSYHRLLKVARTIADLEGAEEIREEHLLEAACYRPVQEYWR